MQVKPLYEITKNVEKQGFKEKEPITDDVLWREVVRPKVISKVFLNF